MVVSKLNNDSFKYKRILKIAGPIALANASVPLIGIVDTGVIGQVGDPAKIAAVGLGSLIISFNYWLFGFLRMGTTGLTAKSRGENDLSEVLNILLRALITGFGAGIILIFLQFYLIFFSMALFNVAPDVEDIASSYIKIRIYAAPFSIMTFSAIGWLIAMERSSLVLLIQVAANALNMLFDLYFVLHIGLGVAGVALASVIAEAVGGILSLCCCYFTLKRMLPLKLTRLFESKKWIKMFSVNFNIFIRSSILEVVMVSYIYIGATFGTVTLAANQILLHFLSVAAYVLDGFAFSAEVLVGISLANRSKKSVREAVKKCTIFAVSGALFFSILFFFFGGNLIALMVLSENVREIANQYLFWAAITPVTGVFAWILDGIFIGSTETSYMRKAMVQAFIFYCGVFFILNIFGSNHALWASINLFLLARAYFLFRYYPQITRNCY